MIDIGANLCHDSFNPDRDEVLQRAFNSGVEKIIVTGSCLDSVPAAIQLAKNHPGFLYTTAGIHPHHAETVNEDAIALLRSACENPEVVATGEMGLDFFRDFCPHNVQERAFHQQLELAVEIGKPLFLHQRDAHDRFLDILKEYLPQLSNVVVHCFTGNGRDLHDYIDLDLHIGITGWICDERRGKHLWDLIPDIPANRLMIETDAPYLLPRNLSPKPEGRRNEPMYLSAVVATISKILSISPDKLAEQTTNNSLKFFKIA